MSASAEHPYEGKTSSGWSLVLMKPQELYKLFSNLDPAFIKEVVLTRLPADGDPWPVLVELWEMSATKESP